MSKMCCTCYPRKVLTTHLYWLWVFNPTLSPTEENTLCLGQGWMWICRKYKIMLHSIKLTDINHSLLYLSIGSNQNDVISIPTHTKPVSILCGNVASDTSASVADHLSIQRTIVEKEQNPALYHWTHWRCWASCSPTLLSKPAPHIYVDQSPYHYCWYSLSGQLGEKKH